MSWNNSVIRDCVFDKLTITLVSHKYWTQIRSNKNPPRLRQAGFSGADPGYDWTSISFKERQSHSRHKRAKGGPSFTKCSIPLRQDWVNATPFPLIPPLPLLFSQRLAALIYLMEGILRRALALVVSLYCNLFPPPDVRLSEHGNIHPQIPVQTYQVVATCLCARRPIGVTGTVTWRLGDWRSGRDHKEERSRQTERPRRQTVEGVGHMLTPADDTRMTRRRKGRSGAQTGCETPTNAVMADTLEFSSLPGSARLSWFIVSYHFSFICFFLIQCWAFQQLRKMGIKKSKNKTKPKIKQVLQEMSVWKVGWLRYWIIRGQPCSISANPVI